MCAQVRCAAQRYEWKEIIIAIDPKKLMFVCVCALCAQREQTWDLIFMTAVIQLNWLGAKFALLSSGIGRAAKTQCVHFAYIYTRCENTDTYYTIINWFDIISEWMSAGCIYLAVSQLQQQRYRKEEEEDVDDEKKTACRREHIYNVMHEQSDAFAADCRLLTAFERLS